MLRYSNLIARMLHFAGNTVTVKKKNGSTETVKAVFVPLLYKNKQYVEMKPSELGKTDDGVYKYLGPSNVVFAADDFLETDGNEYVVERFEKIFVSGRCMYCWAIARPVTRE